MRKTSSIAAVAVVVVLVAGYVAQAGTTIRARRTSSTWSSRHATTDLVIDRPDG